MFLESLATALPPHRFTQRQCYDSLVATEVFPRLRERSRALLEKVLGNGVSGIEARHFCCERIEPVVGRSAQGLNEMFEREAAPLAAVAIERALARAGVEAGDLDALFVCTCTGYLCPGVSSHLAERLGMRDSVFLQDLVGLGCGAAIPMMRAAAGFLAAEPEARVAMVAVEVCSAAFYADDDPGVLISLCLFGDGAAAAVWSGRGAPGQWQAGRFTTVHRPAQREMIRFVNAGGRLKNQLHKEVPALAADAVAALYAQRSVDPQRVLAHSGGRDVIDALAAVLPHPLDETRAVLRDCGNMSSPSLLFALERALATANGERHWWLTAFGAGFAAHACEMWREQPGRGGGCYTGTRHES